MEEKFIDFYSITAKILDTGHPKNPEKKAEFLEKRSQTFPQKFLSNS